MQTNPQQTTEWSERFALLDFTGLQLLIPHVDIYSLEPAADMTPPSPTHIHSVGDFEQSGHVWSLYALSSELNLLTVSPETYRIAVLMKNVQPIYGLLCEQIDSISLSEITIHPIPTAMRCKNSPLLALALYGAEVRYISSASALSCLFPH